jgi:hypothetical protein
MSETPLRPWQRVLRTVVQAAIALAAMLPFIYQAATNGNPEAATGLAATALVIAGGISRVMAMPAVEAFLARYVWWLSAHGQPPPNDERGEISIVTAILIVGVILVLVLLFTVGGFDLVHHHKGK